MSFAPSTKKVIFRPIWSHDQKRMRTRCLGGFLISQYQNFPKNKIIGPKKAKFGPKYAFWSFRAKYWPFWQIQCHDQKNNANGVPRGFSDKWVPKLLPPPKIIRMFGPQNGQIFPPKNGQIFAPKNGQIFAPIYPILGT